MPARRRDPPSRTGRCAISGCRATARWCNLSRLPVPCRASDGEPQWLPAYRVYFGADWIGDESVERIAGAVPTTLGAAEFAYLASPERFSGCSTLRAAPATGLDREEEEVEADEDADQAIETDEHDRWIAFLSWIGVNRALRPVHFHDVEDDATGWLTTRDLAQPQGWAFRDLGDTWTEFEASLRAALDRAQRREQTVPYLYEAHDLDQIVPLVRAARDDSSGAVARALMEHLVRHWSWFLRTSPTARSRSSRGKSPSQRAKPQRALAEELTVAGDNLWLHRLRGTAICPTTHGPRLPSVTWQPVGGARAPLWPGPAQLRRAPARARALGRPAPSRDPLARRAPRRARRTVAVDVRARGRAAAVPPARGAVLHPEPRDRRRQLRDIRPVYRELFQLLSGHSGDAGDTDRLADAPLLADTRDGPALPAGARDPLRGHARNARAQRRRRHRADVRPRGGARRDGPAHPTVRRAHASRTRSNGIPSPGSARSTRRQMDEVREGLAQLLPPLLARIRVERTSANDDPRPHASSSSASKPVLELRLTCTLDGVRLDQVAERPYFVDASPPQLRRAFVVWDVAHVAAASRAAQGLAMALADALGINLVETFLAFIQSDNVQRRRLLDIAGASRDARRGGA